MQIWVHFANGNMDLEKNHFAELKNCIVGRPKLWKRFRNAWLTTGKKKGHSYHVTATSSWSKKANYALKITQFCEYLKFTAILWKKWYFVNMPFAHNYVMYIYDQEVIDMIVDNHHTSQFVSTEYRFTFPILRFLL